MTNNNFSTTRGQKDREKERRYNIIMQTEQNNNWLIITAQLQKDRKTDRKKEDTAK